MKKQFAVLAFSLFFASQAFATTEEDSLRLFSTVCIASKGKLVNFSEAMHRLEMEKQVIKWPPEEAGKIVAPLGAENTWLTTGSNSLMFSFVDAGMNLCTMRIASASSSLLEQSFQNTITKTAALFQGKAESLPPTSKSDGFYYYSEITTTDGVIMSFALTTRDKADNHGTQHIITFGFN